MGTLLDHFNAHKKLLRFVEDVTDFLMEKDESMFLENPLIYSTSGYASGVELLSNELFFSEEHSDWRDMLTELYNIEKTFHTLRIELGHFFKSHTNKKLEELYGLGIEIEEVSDGTGQTNEKVHKEEGTETGE